LRFVQEGRQFIEELTLTGTVVKFAQLLPAEVRELLRARNKGLDFTKATDDEVATQLLGLVRPDDAFACLQILKKTTFSMPAACGTFAAQSAWNKFSGSVQSVAALLNVDPRPTASYLIEALPASFRERIRVRARLEGAEENVAKLDGIVNNFMRELDQAVDHGLAAVFASPTPQLTLVVTPFPRNPRPEESMGVL